MPIDLFSRRYLTRQLEELKPPQTFILSRFFTETETFDTEAVDVDIVTQRRHLAPYVSPDHEGKLLERRGFTTRTYKPPYVKPKVQYKPGDLKKREPGQTINSTNNVSLAARIARDLMFMQETIERREEYQAVQALFTGQSVIQGEGFNDTIDFQMPSSHKVTKTSPNLWTEAGVDILADLRSYRRTIQQDSGLSPNTVVVGRSVADAILTSAGGEGTNASLKGLLDVRRLELGQLGFNPVDFGVTYLGTVLGDLDIFSYDAWYDDGSTEQELIPANKLLMGSTMARCVRMYGAIEDEEFGDGLVPARWWPKTWTTPDPSRRFLMLQSAPLMVPVQVNGFLYAQVV